MSLLGHFFADDLTRAEELARDGPLFTASVKRYLDSFADKYASEEDLRKGGDVRRVLARMSVALADEVAQVHGAERTTEEIIADLDATTHHQKLRELEHLRLTLGNAATQERYAYKLMHKLYGILIDEAHIVKALGQEPENATLREGLISLLHQEAKIVIAIKALPDFSTLFKNLALGTRRKHELDAHEKEASEEIYERMMDTRTLENGQMEATAQHDISELTAHAFNNLDIVAMNAIEHGAMEQHMHALFEYVNSDLFERFIMREARNSFPNLTNQELKVFIHIFRDLYNTRIEQDMY